MAISNLEKVIDQLSRYGDGFVDGALKAQVAMGKKVLELARDVYCPIDTGALRKTGRITADLDNIHLTSVDVQFGGSAAPYALRVHERVDVIHAPPTQAKYLERAAHELEPEMTLRIGDGAVAAAKARSGIR